MLVDAAAHVSGASKRLISPSYLCFGGKAGKIRNTGSRQNKQTERNKQCIDNSTEDRVHREAILFSETNFVAIASPYQIACAAQFPKLSSLAAAASS